MKKGVFFSLILAACLLVAGGCNHRTDLSAVPEVSFSQDVQPILLANCTRSGCHGTENPEEFTLLTYDDLFAHDFIQPGHARKSALYLSISGSGSEERMPPPPDDFLSEESLKLIYSWIEQGAKNN